MEFPGLGITNVQQQNVGLLKKYGEGHYKLIHLRSMRLPGFEERRKETDSSRAPPKRKGKLDNSLSRTRSRVWELAICNSWDYFCTLTLDKEKHNRFDLAKTYSIMAKWFNNLNNRTEANLRYLLMPELHKDGAWHFHGLLQGLPASQITPFTLDDHLPQRLRLMLQAGRQLYNWPAYAQRFGYVTLEGILDPDRCAAYMTKYITKDLQNSSVELNHHLYYCSHGLKRAELVYQGSLRRNLEEPDFANDFVRIKHFASPEEALPYFCDLEE